MKNGRFYLLILIPAFLVIGYSEPAGFFFNILIGIISSLMLLIGFEIRDHYQDRRLYGYLEGSYKREARYKKNEDKNLKSKWALLDSRADNPNLRLIYKSDGEYSIPEIHYDKEWIARGTIFVNKRNRKSGSGVYQYTKKHVNINADFGTYKFFVDELDNRRIYVFHQNYIPSGVSIGYEIWVRK